MRGRAMFALAARDKFLSRASHCARNFPDLRQICLLRRKEGFIISIKVFISIKGKAVLSHK